MIGKKVANIIFIKVALKKGMHSGMSRAPKAFGSKVYGCKGKASLFFAKWLPVCYSALSA